MCLLIAQISAFDRRKLSWPFVFVLTALLWFGENAHFPWYKLLKHSCEFITIPSQNLSSSNPSCLKWFYFLNTVCLESSVQKKLKPDFVFEELNCKGFGLEHLPCMERLKHLKLFEFGKEKIQGSLDRGLKILNSVERMKKEKFFHSNNSRIQGHLLKLISNGLRRKKRNYFFTRCLWDS